MEENVVIYQVADGEDLSLPILESDIVSESEGNVRVDKRKVHRPGVASISLGNKKYKVHS